MAVGMRLPLRCICLSGVLLCAGAASAKTDLLKTRSGSLVHWTGTEISVGLAPSAASRVIAREGVALAVQRAVETWNAVRAGQPRLVVALDQSPDVTIEFCRSKWRGDTIDLGKSVFTASLNDGVVTAATVELNECDHVFTAPHDGAPGRFDLQAVVTHELGHVLGLGHSDNPAAVMHPNGRGAEARKPQTDDKTALALIYFGRTAIESQRNVLADDAPAGSRRAVPRPGGAGVPLPAHSSVTGSAAGESRGANNVAPVDLVSVLSLTARDGQQVLLYTCEPTLLPPIGEVPFHEAKHPTSRRGRSALTPR
jgi:predicted Zn-dependent protease